MPDSFKEKISHVQTTSLEWAKVEQMQAHDVRSSKKFEKEIAETGFDPVSSGL